MGFMDEIDWQEQAGYEKVFEVDDYLYFYGDMLTDELSDRQVAALVRLLELDQPMHILDLGCGHGRHANRLAALGHQVTGFDRSPGFLELARQDAAARGVQVEYRLGDMRQLDYDQAFDRALMMFTVFGYFSDEENLRVLQNIARALKPGGKLLFDIPNRDVFLIGFRQDAVSEKEGNLMIDRNSFDMATGRSYNRRIIIRDGVRRDKPFSVRLYNACEARDLLRQAGLELEQIYSRWEAQPLSTESRRMVIIARKSRNEEK
jgi:SAM-dependent methyltransferase